MKEQVLTSPFVTKSFLKLAYDLDAYDQEIFKDHLIANNEIRNIGNSSFVDYRPTLITSNKELELLGVKKIKLNSLNYFQVGDILNELESKLYVVTKSDIAVNLHLLSSYDQYLEFLPKKKRHELKRKKRNFEKEITDVQLLESTSDDLFEVFIQQHRDSLGDKGDFMTENFKSFFYELLNTDNWKIYYLNSENSILSTAFCYETDKGCYLYNSTRNNLFNDLNPGIILNDLIIQKLINEKKKFFDFLKGTERYKYDFGGTSVQLYDLEISL